jgi:hypothetical protein
LVQTQCLLKKILPRAEQRPYQLYRWERYFGDCVKSLSQNSMERLTKG